MCGGEGNVSLNGKGKVIHVWAGHPGLQEIEAARISTQAEHEGGAVVSLPHRPALPPSRHAWYSWLREAESTPGPQWGRND
jgi:hypothetical protein